MARYLERLARHTGLVQTPRTAAPRAEADFQEVNEERVASEPPATPASVVGAPREGAAESPVTHDGTRPAAEAATSAAEPLSLAGPLPPTEPMPQAPSELGESIEVARDPPPPREANTPRRSVQPDAKALDATSLASPVMDAGVAAPTRDAHAAPTPGAPADRARVVHGVRQAAPDGKQRDADAAIPDPVEEQPTESATRVAATARPAATVATAESMAPIETVRGETREPRIHIGNISIEIHAPPPIRPPAPIPPRASAPARAQTPAETFSAYRHYLRG